MCTRWRTRWWTRTTAPSRRPSRCLWLGGGFCLLLVVECWILLPGSWALQAAVAASLLGWAAPRHSCDKMPPSILAAPRLTGPSTNCAPPATGARQAQDWRGPLRPRVSLAVELPQRCGSPRLAMAPPAAPSPFSLPPCLLVPSAPLPTEPPYLPTFQHCHTVIPFPSLNKCFDGPPTAGPPRVFLAAPPPRCPGASGRRSLPRRHHPAAPR